MSTSLRTISGCLTTRSWAILPAMEQEKMSIVANPSAANYFIVVDDALDAATTLEPEAGQ
ncbi:hypothetical protein [Arthrobacter sp. HY1533]|uniref:hypothetical protein n=1 Tax=Arthrobacter sp. HY1533 TaxID=2970919 RepID=UPI0022BA008D|nr:hypothetical protein [Arthrobacter sp. HY1533]